MPVQSAPPVPPKPSPAGRLVAPHVQAQIQAKPAQPAPRTPAPHVQAALSAVQAKAAPASGAIQRMRTYSNPFDLPTIFQGPIVPGSFFSTPLPTPSTPTPTPTPPPILSVTPTPTPVLAPTRTSSSTTRSGPSPKTSTKKKRSKPVSLGEFLGPRDDTSLFASLGTSGEIDSHLVMFSQFRCGAAFQVSFTLDGRTIQSVSDLTGALRLKPSLYSQTPPITITLYKNRIMSVDNRRLKAHKDAGVRIRFVKKEFSALDSRELSHIDESAPSSLLNVT